jgi:hypothetical protein
VVLYSRVDLDAGLRWARERGLIDDVAAGYRDGGQDASSHSPHL